MLKVFPICLVLIGLSGEVHAQTSETRPPTTLPLSANPSTFRPLSASPLTTPPFSANPVQPRRQAASPGACNAGTLSVCNDSFRSCTSICAATVTAAAAIGVATLVGCNDRCCNEFNICLHQRQCPGNPTNCFAPASFSGTGGIPETGP